MPKIGFYTTMDEPLRLVENRQGWRNVAQNVSNPRIEGVQASDRGMLGTEQTPGLCGKICTGSICKRTLSLLS